MMEALSFGTPVLSFPDKGHSEQENNAAVIDEEGYGRMLSYSTPPEVILECIREVLEEERYSNKMDRLRRLAKELNGTYAIKEMLEKELDEVSSRKLFIGSSSFSGSRTEQHGL
jgi:UDP:flavonoid glycosyltransferase YjiC (YdhE family)